MLVEQYLGKENVKDFIRSLVQTKFGCMAPKDKKRFTRESKFCSDKIDEEPLRFEMKRGIIQLKKYLDPLSVEYRSVLLEDYSEDLVNMVAGTSRIPAYFQACFLK